MKKNIWELRYTYTYSTWLVIVRALEKPSMPGWIWVLILLKGCRWMHPSMVPCESIPFLRSCLHPTCIPFLATVGPYVFSMYWAILICLLIQYVLKVIFISTLIVCCFTFCKTNVIWLVHLVFVSAPINYTTDLLIHGGVYGMASISSCMVL